MSATINAFEHAVKMRGGTSEVGPYDAWTMCNTEQFGKGNSTELIMFCWPKITMEVQSKCDNGISSIQ